MPWLTPKTDWYKSIVLTTDFIRIEDNEIFLDEWIKRIQADNASIRTDSVAQLNAGALKVKQFVVKVIDWKISTDKYNFYYDYTYGGMSANSMVNLACGADLIIGLDIIPEPRSNSLRLYHTRRVVRQDYTFSIIVK